MTSQMSMKVAMRALGAAVLFALLPTAASAQSTIAGVVKDTSGSEGTALSSTVAPFVSSDPSAGGTPFSILQPRLIRIGAQIKF